MKTVAFLSTVNASNYIAGAGMVKGIAVRQLDFVAGKATVSLVNTDDTVRSEVNGVDISSSTTATFETVAADVRAAIAATTG